MHTKSMKVRMWLYVVLVIGIFSMIGYNLAILQIRDVDQYSSSANSRRTKTIPLRGTRGMILDADSITLAEDRLVNDVNFYRDPGTNSAAAY